MKSLGAKDSVTGRTADQTEAGIFWAYDRGGFGPPTHIYNQAVQVISEKEGLNVSENARLFALVNMAMADAGITIWNSKYTYEFWRPINAIREGNTDGNPNTIGDPNWTPLGARPSKTSKTSLPPFRLMPRDMLASERPYSIRSSSPTNSATTTASISNRKSSPAWFATSIASAKPRKKMAAALA